MKVKSAKKPLSHHFTKVTPLSKTIAFILFVTLPFLAFFLGVKYGEIRAQIEQYEDHNNMLLVQPHPTPMQQTYLQGATPTQNHMGY